MIKPQDLSILIITKNEESNIERCIASLPLGCEIVVIDSYSEDRTCAIAVKLGAKVYHRAFDDFSSQKNFGLDKCSKNWVFGIDADEVLYGDLLDALNKSSVQAEAFSITRRLFFMGRELRFGKTIDSPIRLFRRKSGKYIGTIHERFVLDSGSEGRLIGETYLRHYSYKDLTDYFSRFNRYTSAVAINHEAHSKSFSMFGHILRPWMEFFTRYVIRLGFLDGYQGYTYALISSIYAYVKYSKLKELREGVAE